MSGNSGFYMDRDERRRLRREDRERRRAMRGQCDSLAHAIRGPLTLITVGALFAVNNFTPYGFDKTWPVILIVFGLLTLVGRSTRSRFRRPRHPKLRRRAIRFHAARSYRQSSYTQPPAPALPVTHPRPDRQGRLRNSAPPRRAMRGRPLREARYETFSHWSIAAADCRKLLPVENLHPETQIFDLVSMYWPSC